VFSEISIEEAEEEETSRPLVEETIVLRVFSDVGV
jgi:hypothetical protein